MEHRAGHGGQDEDAGGSREGENEEDAHEAAYETAHDELVTYGGFVRPRASSVRVERHQGDPDR